MKEPTIYSFHLIAPFRFNFKQRSLLQIVLILLFVGVLVCGVLIAPDSKGTNGSSLYCVVLTIAAFLLMNLAASKIILNTKITGTLTIQGDLLTANEISLDLKKANMIILSNYLREGKSILPKWKISNRLEIIFPGNEKRVFYVCIYSKENKKMQLSDVFNQLQINNKYYRGKIEIMDKFDFTHSE